MRIGLILPGFSASEEDWCIPTILNLIRELARYHEIYVFTLRYPHFSGGYQVYGAKVQAFGGGVTAGLHRFPLLGRALAQIMSQARRRPFDMFHGLWADEPGFLAATAGRLLGRPTVVSLLGGELVGLPDIGYGHQLSRINRRLIQIALRGAVWITTGSTYIHRLAQLHVSADRLISIPLGVDLELFHPEANPIHHLPLVEGEFKLLHVASLAPVKDQATLLHAFALVARQIPQSHLHIVGEGGLWSHLKGLARALGIRDYVTFHGAAPHDHLPAYYCAADLCVLSSRHESQAMVTLEAAACARVTVGTAVGILPDLGPAGRTTPVGDAPALAEAIMDLVGNPTQRVELGHLARGLVEAKYSLGHTVETLLALYADLARGE